MIYMFPAIFEPDEELGGYCVYFPDFENCETHGITTQGNNLKDAMEMAEDALCLTLYDMEKKEIAIPKASKASEIKTEPTNIVNLVVCDTEFYKKFYENKSVKINATMPLWLKELGEKKKVPFSQILQNGVKEYLNIR